MLLEFIACPKLFIFAMLWTLDIFQTEDIE